MPRLSDAFAVARDEGRAALVGYLPAGFPSVSGAVDVLRAMVDGGVDIVEVGFPYSDPLMDGPVIQQAAEVALRGGTTPADVIRTVEAVAASGTPAVVMTYWNPVLQYGPERFARDLAAAGGCGVITPDLIPDEADEWIPPARATDIDTIFLVAPSSTDARLAVTVDACRGFVYAASVMGVTGARAAVGGAAADLVARTRTVTQQPIAVGLGVSSGDQAADVAGFADGVIVGSAFVRRVLDAPDVSVAAAAAASLAEELASGVRRAPSQRRQNDHVK